MQLTYLGSGTQNSTYDIVGSNPALIAKTPLPSRPAASLDYEEQNLAVIGRLVASGYEKGSGQFWLIYHKIPGTEIQKTRRWRQLVTQRDIAGQDAYVRTCQRYVSCLTTFSAKSDIHVAAFRLALEKWTSYVDNGVFHTEPTRNNIIVAEDGMSLDLIDWATCKHPTTPTAKQAAVRRRFCFASS